MIIIIAYSHWAFYITVCSYITFLANTCTIPPITNGYVVGCSNSQVPFEHTCQFRCNFGYEATDGRGTEVHRTCQKDGTWSGQDLHCEGNFHLSLFMDTYNNLIIMIPTRCKLTLEVSKHGMFKTKIFKNKS